MSLSILSILIMFFLAGPGCRTEAPVPPSSPPPTTPVVEEEAPAGTDSIQTEGRRHPDPEIDAFLVKIEERGRTVDGLRGVIVYRKDEALLNRRELRTGTFAYQSRDDTDPERLAVLFDQLIVNKVRRQRQREYLFDGTWLTEIDHDRKQIIRRQLAPDGEVIGTVGPGRPIPLLTGHTRQDLLSRYDITTYDPAEHEWTATDADVRGLRLKPRAGTPEAGELTSIDVVFDSGTLIPVTVVETSQNGDQKLVRLNDVTVNPDLDDEMKQKLRSGVPDPLPEGWKLHVEPLVTTPTGAPG